MKGEAHLVVSEDALLPGMNVTTQCEEEIQHAVIKFVWDDLEIGTRMPEETVMICSDCLQAVLGLHEPGRRYVTGVTEKRSEVKGEEEC